MKRESTASLRIALIYAAFAALWILLSDEAVAWLFDDSARIIHASILKGWLFVAVTSLLLYFLVGRMVRQLREAHERELSVESERLRALQLLDTIAESSDDAIFAKDIEGRYILVNKAATRFMGRAAAEVLGRDDSAIFPTEQARFLMAIGSRVIAEDRTETNEETLDTAAGIRTFLATKGPLRDPEGRIIGTFGISRDITQYRRVQDELRRERDLANRYLETAQTIMVALDSEGRITMINRSGCEFLGRSQKELLGQQWFATCLPQPEGMEKIYPVFQSIMTGQIEKFERFENSILRSDGQQRLIAWNNAYLADDGGNIGGTFSSGEDITDRQKAIDALRQSEERYRSVVNNVKEVIFQTDAQGLWTFLNPAWTEVTGFPLEASLGTLFLDYVHPDDRQRNFELFEPLIRRQKDYCRHVIRYLHRDGGFRWIEVFARLTLDDADHILGTSGTLTDITERKSAEDELRARNEELERFNTATMDREFDIIELKKQINALSKELGREPPYPLAFLADESQP
ncbi:MAG TPA: PAS domain S-box protein [Rhodocyclaceae bacterium]|nr:PAS domain S-box protein [Rhodocyclaceae bacterium]